MICFIHLYSCSSQPISIHLHSLPFIRKFPDSLTLLSAIWSRQLQFKLLAGPTRMRSTKTKARLPIATLSAPSDFPTLAMQSSAYQASPTTKQRVPTRSDRMDRSQLGRFEFGGVPMGFPASVLNFRTFGHRTSSNHLPKFQQGAVKMMCWRWLLPALKGLLLPTIYWRHPVTLPLRLPTSQGQVCQSWI